MKYSLQGMVHAERHRDSDILPDKEYNEVPQRSFFVLLGDGFSAQIQLPQNIFYNYRFSRSTDDATDEKVRHIKNKYFSNPCLTKKI
jgi:hypothetical protein